MNPKDRPHAIECRLDQALHPTTLSIIDDSASHAGHAGAASGAGHFTVKITSTAFEGKSMIERHRMVYQALSDMLDIDIHALQIQANTPSD